MNLTGFENFIKSVSNILSGVIGLAALFYLPGFIILNLYLSSYGVRDFTLARVTYLLVGSTFVVFHIIPFLLLPLTKSKKVDHAGYILLYVICTILLGLLLYQSLGALETIYFSNPSGFYPKKLGSLGIIIVISILIFFQRWVNGHILEYIIWVLTSFILITALIVWSRVIYPDINPAFSGGQLVKIRVVTDNADKAYVITKTGLDVVDCISSPVGLIDDTGERLIILLQDGSVVNLDKALISNIKYVPNIPSADATSVPSEEVKFNPAIIKTLDDLATPTPTVTATPKAIPETTAEATPEATPTATATPLPLCIQSEKE